MDNPSGIGEIPDDLVLGNGHVHVWKLSLEPSTVLRGRLAGVLSPVEQRRAARFHFDRDRIRFIAARGLLRFILSLYLRLQPGQIELIYGPYGKPALARRANKNGFEFNLAHSDSLALVAVSRSGLVGVDVERIHLPMDMNQLVECFFAPREIQLFQKLPPHLKPLAFFNLWTRKEAWLKATGEGIAHSLNRVEVSFLPGETAQLLTLPTEVASIEQWSLHDLDVAPDFAGALAIACHRPIISYRRWNFSDGPQNSVTTSFESLPDRFWRAQEFAATKAG